MMGDGLHYEPDGKWIIREYNKLAKILCPEIKEAEQKRRKSKNEAIDISIANLVATKKCPCGSTLKQSRSGSKILNCPNCKLRFKATSSKKTNPMNEVIKQYLESMSVRQVNPVNESSNSKKVVGYHYECVSEIDCARVRIKLDEIIYRKKLNYSLSVNNATIPTKTFILYLNN